MFQKAGRSFGDFLGGIVWCRSSLDTWDTFSKVWICSRDYTPWKLRWSHPLLKIGGNSSEIYLPIINFFFETGWFEDDSFPFNMVPFSGVCDVIVPGMKDRNGPSFQRTFRDFCRGFRLGWSFLDHIFGTRKGQNLGRATHERGRGPPKMFKRCRWAKHFF